MISQVQLEAIVTNAVSDGRNADQIARQTGIPLVRVQLMFHKVNGKNPATAAKETTKKRRQGKGYATRVPAHRREARQ
jgi:hypothetical protein